MGGGGGGDSILEGGMLDVEGSAGSDGGGKMGGGPTIFDVSLTVFRVLLAGIVQSSMFASTLIPNILGRL